MATTIAVQMIPQGLLIPRTVLGDWYARELEAVREEQKLLANNLAPLTFLSADDRLNQAASAEGLAVDNPNLHP